MSHLIFLLLVLFSPVSIADQEDIESTSIENIIEEAHSDSRRSFSQMSSAVVEVRNPYGYGTGTLFKKDSSLFVLTAAHVVRGFGRVDIVHGSEIADGLVVFYDEDSDIAVVSVASFESRDPITFRERRRPLSVGDSIGYCGFPNRADLACFDGSVSSLSESYIHVHSYAWMGASGSLVFDERGRAIGVLSAVEVGRFLGIPSIIEDIVWVKPLDEAFLLALDRGFEPEI
jgi:S1-C subfamily serine protease